MMTNSDSASSMMKYFLFSFMYLHCQYNEGAIYKLELIGRLETVSEIHGEWSQMYCPLH